jgi:hypothetical protein
VFVVPNRICFGTKNVNFVNSGTPQVAQDLAKEDVFGKLFAATRMRAVRFRHGG